jgi:hypothetical protein
MQATMALAWVLTAASAPAGTAPFIITAPASHTNYTGTSVSFAVSAGGDAPLIYVWTKDNYLLTDGGNISGSATTNLTVTNLSLTNAGNYAVLVLNGSGRIATNAALTIYTRLVQNGGFETGNFTDWTLIGTVNSDYVFNFSPYVHTGNYGASLGPPTASPGYLSQTVPTLAGQAYLISFWLWLDDTADGVTPNLFSMAWDGKTIFAATNMAATGWTNFQFVATAAHTNALLEFGFGNDSSYFGFDDVSVLPVPAFQSARMAANQMIFTWNVLAGFRYQLQSCTNLARANWNNSGGVFFSESNLTAAVSNAIPPVPAQQFYRAQVLP